MKRDPMGRPPAAILAVMIASLLVFIGASSAQAASVDTHLPIGSLTPPAKATPNAPFQPGSVAVHQATGRIYAIDVANDVIQVFDKSGGFLFMIDGGDAPFSKVPGADNPETGFAFESPPIAIDNSGGPADGRIYVRNDQLGELVSGGSAFPVRPIYALAPNGSLLFTMGPQNGLFANGLAVDSSGNLAMNRLIDGGLFFFAVMDPEDKRARQDNFDQERIAHLREIPVNASTLMLDDQDNPYVATGGFFGKLNPFGKLDWKGGEAGDATAAAFDAAEQRIYLLDEWLLFGFEGAQRTVAEYDLSGTLLGRFGLSLIPNSGHAGIAVDESSSRIYVSDPAYETGPPGEEKRVGRVIVFGSQATATAPDVTAGAATDLTDTSATLNGIVNPVGTAAGWRFQYRQAKTRKWQSTPLQSAGSGTADVSVSTPLVGLSQNRQYEVRMQGANEANGAVSTSSTTSFKTLGQPLPILAIDPPADLTATSLKLSGSVDPNGSDAKWHFEYATDNSFEEDWTAAGKGETIPSASGATGVSAGIEGLEPNKHYFARLVATNAGGRATSSELEFTTPAVPPEAFTLAAGCLTTTSACLGAIVDPKNSTTSYYFEYGPDANYGSVVPLAKDGVAGSGFGPVKVTEQVADLEPGTVYHYRVVATSTAGSLVSPDATFSTRLTSTELSSVWPARGFELVNPPDKGNSLLEPASSPELSVSPDGSRALWVATGPAATGGTGGIFLSTRTPAGWNTRSLTPPAAEQPGGGEWNYNVQRISPDFSSVLADFNNSLSNEGFIPGILARLDDQGKQSILGSPTLQAIPSTPDQYHSSADGRHVVLPDPTGTGNLVEYFEGGSRVIDVPSCGYEVPRVTPDGSIGTIAVYPWLASHSLVAFTQSAGEGPCTAPQGVFRIDIESGEKELISGPQTSKATFQRTNADGTAAIYTKDGEIFRWEQGAGSACLSCFTGGTNATGAMLIADDLGRIYFTSLTKIIPGEGIAGASNLYVLRDGDVDFIAVLGGYEQGIALTDNKRRTSGNTAAATDDARVLVFASNESRTSASNGGQFQNIYRYDDATGRLECVSCWSSPVTMTTGLGFQGEELPPFVLSGDGRTVAFTTTAPLTPRDVNGTRDVYEWHDGGLRLVTDGVTEISDSNDGRPLVWGLSSDGRTLLFQVGARLVGNELDPLSNLYDARVGGGTVIEEPPAPCVEDSCQGPLEAPPPLSNPGSSAFSGPGNHSAPRKAKKNRKASKRQRAKRKKRNANRKKRAGRSRGGVK